MTGQTLHIPTLRTERLILRAPRRGDFDAFADLLATDRTSFMGGPFTRKAAWNMFTTMTACWVFHGFGGWLVTASDNGAFLGDVGISQSLSYPEPELGWTLVPEAEGKGIAREAAQAALDWYWTHTDAQSVVSYITPGNTRSEALATRLGARPDPAAPLPEDETPQETTVYRHRRPA